METIRQAIFKRDGTEIIYTFEVRTSGLSDKLIFHTEKPKKLPYCDGLLESSFQSFSV